MKVADLDFYFNLRSEIKNNIIHPFDKKRSKSIGENEINRS